MPEDFLSVHPAVQEDIKNIVTYIAQDDRQAALRVAAKIRSTIELIGTPNLNVGSLWQTDIPELQGIHFFPIPRYGGRFLIFWMPKDNEIRILYVLRASLNINQVMKAEPRE